MVFCRSRSNDWKGSKIKEISGVIEMFFLGLDDGYTGVYI